MTESARITKWDIFTLLLGFILAFALVCVVVTPFLIPTAVSGHSMDPTLADGNRYMVLRLGTNPLADVQRGDIVVVDRPDIGRIVKRVIALPGDTVQIFDNQVYVNGKALSEDYINEPMVTPDTEPVLLEQGQYYVLGDNRNISADSRIFGTFTAEELWGVVDLQWQSLLWIAFLGIIAAAGTFSVSLTDALLRHIRGLIPDASEPVRPELPVAAP